MRILIVSSFLPFPLHSGGHIRLYNLMKQLARHHRLTLVCEKRNFQTNNNIAEIKKFCEDVYVVDRKKQWSIKNVAMAGISPYPFLLVGHSLPEMKKIIIDVLKKKTFDLIHVETFYVYQNLPKTYLPVVLAEHNIEHQVYRKYVSVAPLPLRPLLLADIEKMKYWEKKFWGKTTKLVAVSEADKMEMGREDAVVVPNGVDLKNFKFQISDVKFQMKEKRVLFMGDFKWLQNVQAANFILDNIWPFMQSSIINNKSSINLKLWIVGKHIPENIKTYNNTSIIIDEHAPDETAKIYQKAFLLLAPIRVGGGTSYKILEAMASGVPVITTQLGVKGLQAVAGKEALVGESPEELANLTISLLEEKEKYEKIAREARKFIEEKYSWEYISQKLEAVYQEATNV